MDWTYILETMAEVFFPLLAMLAALVLIAYFVYQHYRHKTDAQTQIMLAAIEKSDGYLPDNFVESLTAYKHSSRKTLLTCLALGTALTITGMGLIIYSLCNEYSGTESWMDLILLGSGVGFLTYFFAGRKLLQTEPHEQNDHSSPSL